MKSNTIICICICVWIITIGVKTIAEHYFDNKVEVANIALKTELVKSGCTEK